MRASQNVTRRIDDLVQSNHSIPNGPHVRPLTSFRSNSKRHVNINPSSGLFSSPHHILTVPSAFSKKWKHCGLWFFLALGTLLISKTHCQLSDVSFSSSEIQNIFEKLVAIVPMLGLALDTDCAHFQKSYLPTLMFLFLEKTVHVFRMLCWRWEFAHFQNTDPIAPMFDFLALALKIRSNFARPCTCSFWS
jgi:hypothetical protein